MHRRIPLPSFLAGAAVSLLLTAAAVGLSSLLASTVAGASASPGPPGPGGPGPDRRDWGGADGPYLKGLHERVHPRWSTFLSELQRLDRRYQDPALAVEVVLVIDQTGTLERIEQDRQGRPAHRGPLKGFDDAPAELLRDLGALPPPPAALRSDDGRVYVRWRFTRKGPGCEDLAVIERRLPLRDALPKLVRAGRAAEVARRLASSKEVSAAERGPLLHLYVEELGKSAARDEDAVLRELSAAVLAHLPDGEADLLDLLDDREASVRVRALEALSTRELGPNAVPMLRRLLKSGDRAAAALLLAHLKDREAVPALREALAAGHRPLEMTAALMGLGDTEEATRIAQRLLARPETFHAGALSARALGDPQLTRALLREIGGPEPLRAAILDAIGAMGPKAPPEARKIVFGAMVDLSPRVRARAMLACAALGERSLGLRYRLMDALGDPNPEVRAAAAAALVEVGGEGARDELKLLALREQSVLVKASLLQAALAHPYPSAGALIQRLRKEPEVARAARLSSPENAEHRAPLLAARAALGPGVLGEDARLTERLLQAADERERLRAAADWLALER